MNSLKHIGGSQSESSPYTRCANALADRIASRVALARRFNIKVMLRIGKAKTSMKTPLVTLLRLENPKPPMAWQEVRPGDARWDWGRQTIALRSHDPDLDHLKIRSRDLPQLAHQCVIVPP